jgi:hypothetical protein
VISTPANVPRRDLEARQARLFKDSTRKGADKLTSIALCQPANKVSWGCYARRSESNAIFLLENSSPAGERAAHDDLCTTPFSSCTC